MKTIQDCVKFANENPLCFLATVDNDQPRVRALSFWFADETGFYLQTGSMKEIPHQLKENPKAEICFYHQDASIGTMLRVSGMVEFINDRKLKERSLIDRPFLKAFGFTADSEELIIIRIPHGGAHFWTMENNMKPKEFIKF